MFWKYPQEFQRIAYKPGETAEYVWGDGILMALITLDSETEGSVHDCEQISWMVDGELELRIGDEVKTVKKGDAFHVPAGVFHRVTRIIQAPGVILDCWPRGGPHIPD